MTVTMTPLYAGNTRVFTATVKNASTGLPVDITGDTVIATIKDYKCNTDNILQITNTTHIAPTLGKTTFTISAEQSALFPVRNLVVDITWIRAVDETYTVLDAILPILQPVRTP